MLNNVGLYRSKRDRWVMGVCGGIAHQFGISATLTRVLTIVLAVIVPGISFIGVVLIYIALGILLPESDTF
jgi:phage shock protein C